MLLSLPRVSALSAVTEDIWLHELQGVASAFTGVFLLILLRNAEFKVGIILSSFHCPS